MTGRRASRDKGNRIERALVHALQDAGFAAERVPLSGAARGRFGGDLSVPLLGIDRRVEVKCRGNGFRQLYAWLDGADLLIVRADHCEPLVMLPVKLAVEIATAAERAKVLPTTATTPPHDFTNYLLTELRCASLRAHIMQADIEAIGLALKGGLVTPDQALALPDEVDALRIVGTPPEASP
jgi:hypothetical protein